jgi:glycosyltransferase 2 family protein
LANWRIGLLGIIVSLAAILFIVTQIDPRQIWTALITARYQYILLCGLLLVLALFPRALRWRVLLDDALPFHRAFSIINVAFLVNGILPLRIGEVARVYLATRADETIPMMKSASTVITERLLDLFAIVIMALIALSAAPLPDQVGTTALILGPLAIVGFSVLVLMARWRTLTEQLILTIVERIPMLQRLPVQSLAAHFLDGLTPITRPGSLAAAVGLTALSWATSASAGYVLMFAFYDVASWTTTLLYIASAAFAIALPAVPGNLGTYELSILAALDATGYSIYTGSGQLVSAAVSFAVMVHLINFLVHTITGIIGLEHEGISIKQLTEAVTQMQQRVGQTEAS